MALAQRDGSPAELAKRRRPRLAGLVERRLQTRRARRETRSGSDRGGARVSRHGPGLRFEPRLVHALQVLQERLLVFLRIVHEAAERAEPHLHEPRVHHVERGALLAHEQHTAPVGDGVGDEVRDRLGLAGARWPLDHERGAAPRACDRGRLCRVREHHVVPLLEHERRDLARERPRLLAEQLLEHGVGRRCAFRRIDEGRVVAHQRDVLVVEVCEREARQVERPVVRVGVLRGRALPIDHLRDGVLVRARCREAPLWPGRCMHHGIG